MRRYFRIWRRLAVMSFLVQAESFMSSFGYLLGKLLRISFFLYFLFAIFKHTDLIAGYSLNEIALFFITFNIVDIVAQLFFRGIYGVRSLIREGDFDYFLIQPTNVLFRVAFHTVDFLDVITVFPILALTIYILKAVGADAIQVVLYALLAINGLLIAFAIHIAVAAIAVLTQELENTIWIYRDLMTLGRFPSDIYAAPMQYILTFIVPIAVMISFPAKACLGHMSAASIGLAVLVACAFLAFSITFWRLALARYTSVSS